MTTLMTLDPMAAKNVLGERSSEDSEVEMLELNVRLFEQSLVKALMDPLDQQSLASLYLASMKLLPYLSPANHPPSASAPTRPTARATHRQSLIDRLFLLLLALHHPLCSLGKSKQKLKKSSANPGLPRDWLLAILADSLRQK